MTPLMMYYWLKLDCICDTIRGFVAIIVVVWVFGTVVYAVSHDDDNAQDFRKSLKPFLKMILPTAFLILVTIVTLLPTTKQAAIIFGVPYLIENAKGINLDKLPIKVVDYLNAYLDDETKRLRNETR